MKWFLRAYSLMFFIHIDFQKADPERPIRIKVPVKAVGTPYGVLRQGGVLQQNAQETELLCLPKDIPDYIDVDVSKLNLHELVRARDISGYNFTTPSQSLFSVATSRAARILEAVDTTEEE
jgi:large subunit ribosomal protein L25